MVASQLAVGEYVRLQKSDLQQLLTALAAEGYRVVGPQVAEGAIVYDDLDDVAQLPLGYLDEQDGGRYRLHQVQTAGYFDHVAGPHSLKQFVFPPRESLLHANQDSQGHWHMSVPEPPAPAIAVIGMRACDLHALRILDRTLLQGPYVDRAYEARRKALFLAAVNCRRAAATCFCHSMGAGPAAGPGYDLSLTERDTHFVVQIGSQRGCEIVQQIDHEQCPAEEAAAACRQAVELEA